MSNRQSPVREFAPPVSMIDEIKGGNVETARWDAMPPCVHRVKTPACPSPPRDAFGAVPLTSRYTAMLLAQS